MSAGLYKEGRRHSVGPPWTNFRDQFATASADDALRAVMRLAVPSCGTTSLLLHGCRRLAAPCAPGRVSTAVSRPRMTAAPSTAAASTAAASIGPGPPPPPPLAAGSSGFAAFIPGFLHWVDFCNNGAAAAAAGEFLGLSVGGKTVGYLKPRCGGVVGRAHPRRRLSPSAVRPCAAALCILPTPLPTCLSCVRSGRLPSVNLSLPLPSAALRSVSCSSQTSSKAAAAAAMMAAAAAAMMAAAAAAAAWQCTRAWQPSSSERRPLPPCWSS